MTNEEQGIRGALSMLATLTAEGHEELEEKLRAQEENALGVRVSRQRTGEETRQTTRSIRR